MGGRIMGILREVLDVAKQVILLNDEVTRLATNVASLAEKLEATMHRVTTLEARDEVILARAEAAATTAGHQFRSGEIGEIRERLVRIEMHLSAAAGPGIAAPVADDSK